MAYTKQTWATGDVVTANKMNHIEDGIAANETAINAASGIVLTFPDTPTRTVSNTDYYEETHGYTWQDVVDAFTAGRVVRYLISGEEDGYQYNHIGTPYQTEICPDGGEQYSGFLYSILFDFTNNDLMTDYHIYAEAASGVLTTIHYDDGGPL